mmetsp:Transcript_26948/g.43157  ORF Transcript_26948/g.43157 Transcript_26948/m.43157 type:complete len:126 (-) Transcript_26948:2-379(-)
MMFLVREVKLHLRRLWRSLDHPDGKLGLTVTALGENLTFFDSMSPKKALIVSLFLGSTAFWLGTGIGLGVFCAFFDVPADIKARVLHAAYLGMVAMYASVMFGVVHVVFFRRRHDWTIDVIDRAL